jgi:hypothetical protein
MANLPQRVEIPVMSKLSPQQFADSVRNLAQQVGGDIGGMALQRAAQSVHAMQVVRIFDEGISGASYSTKGPIYVEDSKLRRKANRGKTGKAEKTSRFDSYRALKVNQMGTDKVNLRLTNDMQMDFANSAADVGAGRPVAGPVTKVSNSLVTVELRRPENVKKWAKLKRQYGNFDEFTANEQAEFFKLVNLELTQLIQQKLG